MSTNGVVSFGAFGSAAFANETLPSPRLPSLALAAFWDDLEVRSARGGAIYVQTLGAAPRRDFVIQFHRLNHWPDLPGEVTFEVVLVEGSNNILVQYQDAFFGGIFADRGGSATVGIQGLRRRLGGTETPTATQYSFNQQVLPDGLAILFDPDFVPPSVSIPRSEPRAFSPELGESTKLSATVEDGRCTPETEFEIVGPDGQVVRTIDAGTGSGARSATWDGTDDSGLRVAPGPYRLVARAADGLTVGSRDSRENGAAVDRYVWVLGSVPDDVTIPCTDCEGDPFPIGAALYRTSQQLLSGSGRLGGDRDPRTVVSGPSVSQGAAFVCAPPNSAWLPLSSEAQWIGAAPCSPPVAGGEFTYVTTFDLPDGFLTPRLAVDVAADNGVRVLLNGTQIGENPSPNGFTATVRIETDDPALFRPGANELAFRVTNEGEGPSGLWFDATVRHATGAVPPPPGLGSSRSIDLERDSTQWLSASDSASLSFTGSFTLELWVRLESGVPDGEGFGLISKTQAIFNTDNSFSFILRNVGGQHQLTLSLGFGNAANDSSINIPSPSTATWYHYAVVFTAGSQVEFFVDGVSQGALTRTDTTFINDSGSPVRVGMRLDNESLTAFDGLIDEVRVWSAARTSAQIAENGNKELQGNEADLAAYWKLNNTYDDSTPNGNTLTPHNDPVFSEEVPF